MNLKRILIVFFYSVLLLAMGIISGLQSNVLANDNVCLSEQNNNGLSDVFDLLIVAPSEFNDALHLLVDHKNNVGIQSRIVNIDQINMPGCRDKQEEIKWYIKASIEEHDISYVLLVGDREKIPVRYSYSAKVGGLDPFISDLYYADIYDEYGEFCSWDSNDNDKFGELSKDEMIDELDLYPDVYLGRLLCSNVSEVTTVVDKIIDYETNTFGQEWFHDIILCGGDTHPGIILTLLNMKGYEGELLCEEVKQIMDDFDPILLYTSAILPSFLKPTSDDATFLTFDEINTAINQGAGFVLFSGHGSVNGWNTHSPILKNIFLYLTTYRSELVKNLDNENKLPIIVMDACSCGDFSDITGTASPIAWDFVKKPGGGAIATIACTTLSLDIVGKSFTDFLSGYFTTQLFLATSSGYAGEMLGQAQRTYLNSFSDYDHQDCLIVEEFTLFGDPSLKIGGYDL